MEKHVQAILAYENKRQEAEQKYRNDFQSWKKQNPKAGRLGDVLRNNPFPRDPNNLIWNLMRLCSVFVKEELVAFTILLKQLGIAPSQAVEVLGKHTKAVQAEIYEHK